MSIEQANKIIELIHAVQTENEVLSGRVSSNYSTQNRRKEKEEELRRAFADKGREVDSHGQRAPREWWFNPDAGEGSFAEIPHPYEAACVNSGCIRVREVLD